MVPSALRTPVDERPRKAEVPEMDTRQAPDAPEGLRNLLLPQEAGDLGSPL